MGLIVLWDLLGCNGSFPSIFAGRYAKGRHPECGLSSVWSLDDIYSHTVWILSPRESKGRLALISEVGQMALALITLAHPGSWVCLYYDAFSDIVPLFNAPQPCVKWNMFNLKLKFQYKLKLKLNEEVEVEWRPSAKQFGRVSERLSRDRGLSVVSYLEAILTDLLMHIPTFEWKCGFVSQRAAGKGRFSRFDTFLIKHSVKCYHIVYTITLILMLLLLSVITKVISIIYSNIFVWCLSLSSPSELHTGRV
jgi:hypothetical protein